MRDCGMPRPVLLQALDALSAAGVIVQGAAVVADSTMIRILPPLGGFRMRQDDGSPNRAVFAPAVHVPDVIQISIRWRGGATRKVECPLPLTAPDLRRTPAALVEQVRVLATEQTDGQIAETLNGRWLRTGCGLPFTSTRVRTLRGSYDIDSYLQHLTTAGWLTVPQMAAQLNVHLSTAKRFAQEGVLRAGRADDKGPGLVNGSRRYRTRESTPARGDTSRLAPAQVRRGREPQVDAFAAGRGAIGSLLVSRQPAPRADGRVVERELVGLMRAAPRAP